MNDMRVVVKMLTYPLFSKEPPDSTMFLAMRTSPLIQQHHAAQLPVCHITTLYDVN